MHRRAALTYWGVPLHRLGIKLLAQACDRENGDGWLHFQDDMLDLWGLRATRAIQFAIGLRALRLMMSFAQRGLKSDRFDRACLTAFWIAQLAEYNLEEIDTLIEESEHDAEEEEARTHQE